MVRAGRRPELHAGAIRAELTGHRRNRRHVAAAITEGSRSIGARTADELVGQGDTTGESTACVTDGLQPSIGRSVRDPVSSGIAIRVYRHASQTCCPFNIKFAQALAEPAFAAREILAGKDARQLARDLLDTTQEEFSAAFKGSPMKRAKLRGLRRNAAVVLGNVGKMDDVPVLEAALAHDEPLVREHAARAPSGSVAGRRPPPVRCPAGGLAPHVRPRRTRESLPGDAAADPAVRLVVRVHLLVPSAHRCRRRVRPSVHDDAIIDCGGDAGHARVRADRSRTVVPARATRPAQFGARVGIE